MKNFYLLFMLSTFIGELSAQNLFFPIRKVENIQLMDNSQISSDYKKYPYADITVVIRRADKLTSPEFVKSRFKSIKYFYGELELASETANQKIPLFLFEKGKNNSFNTSTIEDRTILKKYLYKPEEKRTLDAIITTQITINNRALSILSSMSDIVSPLITNPTGLVSVDVAKKTYTFFSSLLKQAAEDQKLEAKVLFEPFKNQYKKILSYNIYFFAPTDAELPKAENLRLNKSASGYFSLLENGTEYEEFPYLIVLQTLNNYYGLEGIPSKRIERAGYTTITDGEIRALDSILIVNKSSISDQQNFAEAVLLDYLKIINKIEKALSSNDEEPLTNAYSAILKFEDIKKKAKEIEPALYTDANSGYAPVTRKLNDQIDIYFKRLTYYSDLQKLNVFNAGGNNVSNDALGLYSAIIAKVSAISFLKNNLIVTNAKQKLEDLEQALYNNKFKGYCERLNAADDITDEYNAIKSSLQNMVSTYSNCSKCVNESKIALNKYLDLVSIEEDRRLIRAVNDTIFYCTETIKTYRRKIETFNSFSDSIKATINLGTNINSVISEASHIEDEIRSVAANNKTKFTRAERRALNDSLKNLKKAVEIFDSKYRVTFEKISEGNKI
ncbi:hypothetical protein [Niastella populi]|uniref:Uncharacterized protein n=1 Tax=Niastella populi TaxID=550983 RepID=A0A1V9GB62_9BACT|nr:hypothetical protein [Niastella populi]OQP67853.1 hypothetical protein A4R26_10120 [Niastella populi]